MPMRSWPSMNMVSSRATPKTGVATTVRHTLATPAKPPSSSQAGTVPRRESAGQPPVSSTTTTRTTMSRTKHVSVVWSGPTLRDRAALVGTWTDRPSPPRIVSRIAGSTYMSPGRGRGLDGNGPCLSPDGGQTTQGAETG